MKLEIVAEEATVVREIFDWADQGRGGRWIVRTLNERGTSLRAARFRTGKGGRYAYYTCNAKVNRGGTCACPSIRHEQLDGVVLDLVERELLAKDRLRTLLSGVVELSDQKRAAREGELTAACAEQARLRTAINRLLVLVEEGTIGPGDPAFAERMATNRASLAAITGRIDTLETQLAPGSRKITHATVDRFGKLLSAKLGEDDPALRSAYLRMFVSNVRVSDDSITTSGPTAALEAGAAGPAKISTGAVPSLDRKWCPTGDNDGHSNHCEIAISRR